MILILPIMTTLMSLAFMAGTLFEGSAGYLIPTGIFAVLSVLGWTMYAEDLKSMKRKKEQEEERRKLEELHKKQAAAKAKAEAEAAEKKAKEFDIIPNRPYDKALAKAHKLCMSDNAKNRQLGNFIVKLLESKQYLASKRVMLTTAQMEICLNFWPAIFDGIEVLTDDDGNGYPDEWQNSDDYFEVSKPKAKKKS